MKAISLRSTKRPNKKVPDNPGSITTPNLSLSVAKIIERSQMGMEIQSQNAIYLGPQDDEFSQFDKMDKMEQIDAVREFTKRADKDLKKHKEAITKAQLDKKEAEAKQYREHVKAQVLQELKEQKL